MSERGYESWSGFHIGEKVVTRRGKTGTVVAINDDGTYEVKFGSYDPITLRETQVVTEAAYRKMQAGASVLASNQRYNNRP